MVGFAACECLLAGEVSQSTDVEARMVGGFHIGTLQRCLDAAQSFFKRHRRMRKPSPSDACTTSHRFAFLSGILAHD